MEINTITEDEESTSKTDIESELVGRDRPDVKHPNPRISRKRTKTGCLTCRRRRIKCGEERPTCANCAKSKRQCQGYNQRVIFKDPLNTFRGSASAATSNSALRRESTASAPPAPRYGHTQDAKPPPQAPLPNIAPKLNSPHEIVPVNPESLQAHQGQSDQVKEHRAYSMQQNLRDGALCKLVGDSSRHGGLLTGVPAGDPNASGPVEYRDNINERVSNTSDTRYRLYGSHENMPKPQAVQSNTTPHVEESNSQSHTTGLSDYKVIFKSSVGGACSTLLTQPSREDADNPLSMAERDVSHLRFVSYPETPAPPTAGVQRLLYSEWLPEVRGESRLGKDRGEEVHQDAVDHHEAETFGLEFPQHVSISHERESQMTALEGDVSQKCESNIQRGGPNLQETAAPRSEPFDEDENAEMLDPDSEAAFTEYEQDHLRNNDLGIFVALQATQDQQDQSLRTYHSFIHYYAPDMLIMYQPSARSSPLNDSVTARIFYHFINVIAPSISMYERHPANPSLLFQGRPVHISQQHIWAYTMPTFALGNQALLHAMLALGSLHIARVQDGPITASLKHYHIALRRIAKNVGLPTRRSQPATLAATMLLGWYEVMSSDHQKWSNHVLGAKQLLREIDFAGMTRYLKTERSQRRAWRGNLYHHDMALGIANELYSQQPESLQVAGSEDEVNENLVSVIMGRKFHYDQHGQIPDDINMTGDHKGYTRRDLEIYETQRDLFWWYCKQDMYQSVLSGSRLFMPYNLWSHCLPRAPVGRLDAVYGTFDHVILLLGRLADFTAKDLKRKRKVMQANGGQRRPPLGVNGWPNTATKSGPSQSLPPYRSFDKVPTQVPLFAGMIPGTEGKATLPRGFSPKREEPPISMDFEDHNIEYQTAEADEEWHEIRSAFDMLADSFGPDFQALGPECSRPVQTPFGPALQYRTYGIGGIWMSYYMGLILCHRAHPSMPPAAMMAAGVAARETAFFANEIGRIAAGICPNSSAMTQVHTGVGAGLIESCFSLFVAGVQYQDSTQRAWLVQKCQDITRLTGWQTAQTIGAACETSWIKAAEAGRGPSYVRATENGLSDSVKHPYSRRVDYVLSERGHDDSKLKVTRIDKVHYALGLLGVEDDFKNLDFECDDQS